MSLACPHCAQVNPEGSKFCETCGLAVPERDRPRPRIIEREAFAASGIGRGLQLEQLDRQGRAARNIMLAIGILQLAFGCILGAVAVFGTPGTPAETQGMYIMAVSVGIVGAIFIGLSLWARRSPLAATVVGLVLYLSLIAADAIANPATLLNGVIIKVIFIAALAKAVSAGVKHRSLRVRMQEVAPATA